MKNKIAIRLLVHVHPLQRVLISLGCTLTTFLAFVFLKITLSPLIFYMFLWDVFAITYIVTCWIVFYNRSIGDLRKWARIDDGSRIFVSSSVITASFISLVIVLLLMLSRDVSGTTKTIYSIVAVTGMLASWVMVHTTFTFHYANLYYADDVSQPTKHAAGLNFPEEKRPDYLDFAYFAFVIGMTFQVSDVEVSDRIIRRTVLAHGLLSFVLNTFVLALTINLIAGLKQ